MTPRLRLNHITKAYPGIVANDDICLEVCPGEVLAILGENGAGKSTTLSAKENAVGLPTATWSLTKWTVDDYNAMLAKMADGSLVVDNDYSKLDSTDSLTLNLVK